VTFGDDTLYCAWRDVATLEVALQQRKTREGRESNAKGLIALASVCE